MYWNNPIVTATVGQWPDPIELAQHQGQHCLFYDPAVPEAHITKLDWLDAICDTANQWIHKLDAITDAGQRNKTAKTVRINLFLHSLRTHGNIKPMLMYYRGSVPYTAANGGTRLLAAERMPELTSWPCFISTHQKFRNQFQHLTEIKSLQDFASVCKADKDTKFLFRLTDASADYGIDWYEAQLGDTWVPNDDQCLTWLQTYLASQPSDFRFTPQWFDQEIDWTTLGHH